MKNYLKKVLIKKNIVYMGYGIIISILLFFIYLNFTFTNEFIEVEKIEKQILKKDVLKNQDNIDTDNDGLLDWQEFLYHTDVERADTDNDGVSDKDEVLLGRDPVVFGEGSKNEIEKVQKVQENVFTLDAQKKQLSKIYKKQEEYQELLQSISKKPKKSLSESDKEFIKSENIRKKHIREDLNNAGAILKGSYIDIVELMPIFNNMFMFFNTSNEASVQKILEENANVDDNFLTEYHPLSENELKKIDSLAYSYIYISKELSKITIVDNNIKNFLFTIEKKYLVMGKELLFLTKQVRKGDRKVKVDKEILKYLDALMLNVENRKNIDEFIRINNIHFSDSEAGNIFVYSL